MTQKTEKNSCICFREKDQNAQTYMQNLIIKMQDIDLEFCFVYIRRKPSEKDIDILKKRSMKSALIMGDLNLDIDILSDKKKLHKLCNENLYIALKE